MDANIQPVAFPAVSDTGDPRIPLIYDWIKTQFWPKLDNKHRAELVKFMPRVRFEEPAMESLDHWLTSQAPKVDCPPMIHLLLHAIWGEEICRRKIWWTHYRNMFGCLNFPDGPAAGLTVIRRLCQRQNQNQTQQNQEVQVQPAHQEGQSAQNTEAQVQIQPSHNQEARVQPGHDFTALCEQVANLTNTVSTIQEQSITTIREVFRQALLEAIPEVVQQLRDANTRDLTDFAIRVDALASRSDAMRTSMNSQLGYTQDRIDYLTDLFIQWADHGIGGLEEEEEV